MHFQGKLLVINSAEGGGAVIEAPQLVELGGKKFIVGTSVLSDDDGPKWTSGCRIWLGVDHIISITEIDSPEEYLQRLRVHRHRESGSFM